jgi:TetR/AcrR family transcriptional regulator, transcriptional repressor for nem operon
MPLMAPGRPLNFDPDTALDQALGVFWRQGYEGTSMADLLEATSLSKSSLYQAFGSKQALFERCLERYSSNLLDKMEADLSTARSARAFIEQVFASVAHTARTPAGAKGCLIGNSANEFGQREPDLSGPVSANLDRLTAVLARAVGRAQREGEISEHVDARALATYLVGAMNGLRTMIKAGMDRRSAAAMVVLILKALD